MSNKEQDGHSSRKKMKVAITLVVLLFVGIAAYFLVPIITRQIDIASKGYDVQEIRQDFEKQDSAERNADATTNARDAFKDGNDQRATDIYEQAVAAEPDPIKKVKLAINQSLMLYNLHKDDEAEAVAKKAESYSSDKFYISDWLGRLYELMGKYSDAAKYYQSAASLAGSPTNNTGFDKAYYQAKVMKMKSLTGKSS